MKNLELEFDGKTIFFEQDKGVTFNKNGTFNMFDKGLFKNGNYDIINYDGKLIIKTDVPILGNSTKIEIKVYLVDEDQNHILLE